MPRLSKTKRDQLKAEGSWFGMPQVPASFAAKCAPGAELFAAAAFAANPDFEPHPGFAEPEFHVDIYPDLGSYADGIEEIVSDLSPEEIRATHSVDKAGADVKQDCYVSVAMAMASRLTESTNYHEASSSQTVPLVGVHPKVIPAVEHLGSFDRHGVTFEYADVSSAAKSLLRFVAHLHQGVSLDQAKLALALPSSSHDENFKFHTARFLAGWFDSNGVPDVCEYAIRKSLFSGTIPDFLHYSELIHDDKWIDVKPLFWEYKDAPSFVKHVLKPETARFTQLKQVPVPCPDLMFNKTFRDLCVYADHVAEGLRNEDGQCTTRSIPQATQGSPVQLVSFDEKSVLIPSAILGEQCEDAPSLAAKIRCLASVSIENLSYLGRTRHYGVVRNLNLNDLEPENVLEYDI